MNGSNEMSGTYLVAVAITITDANAQRERPLIATKRILQKFTCVKEMKSKR